MFLTPSDSLISAFNPASPNVDTEGCEHEMFVNIAWQQRLLAVPLSQLAGVAVDEGTEQAIQDWHTWVERGYVL